ncbi:MAG: rsxB 4 [Firmicutes bacterium]|nr:rsxB 4 [Bacillota bacterium]
MNAITTLKANCQDCHRCLRACPVKAIGIESGQARHIDEKCVLCGRCVADCPQQAKVVVDDIEFVKAAIMSGRKMAVSVAPSFVAVSNEQPAKFFARLYGIGFQLVEETAVGAALVSRLYVAAMAAKANCPVISACCPVTVRMIKKYYPSLVNNLAPVVSPMEAHARMIKKRLGQDTMVVFAGPCIGKIAEKNESGSAVDAVITFSSLRDWLAASDFAKSKEFITRENASNLGRFYPIPGGIVKTFSNNHALMRDFISVDGMEQCAEVFSALVAGEIAPRFIETLACQGGCINGPVIGISCSAPAKRLSVIAFAEQGNRDGNLPIEEADDYFCRHQPELIQEIQPSESEIYQVLCQTGKYTPADEKNCGACGFNTCKEKAIAVCQGLTSVETCVPYMRSKAESFANIIVDNSLNGIIVVNKELEIQDFNRAAKLMFRLENDIVIKKQLTEFMDCSDVKAALLARKKVSACRIEIPRSDVIASQMIIPVENHGLIIIILTDMSALEKSSRELEQVKRQTIEKATEIINKQMQVAQEIAGLLGETTADTKAALFELIGLVKQKEDN